MNIEQVSEYRADWPLLCQSLSAIKNNNAQYVQQKGALYFLPSHCAIVILDTQELLGNEGQIGDTFPSEKLPEQINAIFWGIGALFFAGKITKLKTSEQIAEINQSIALSRQESIQSIVCIQSTQSVLESIRIYHNLLNKIIYDGLIGTDMYLSFWTHHIDRELNLNTPIIGRLIRSVLKSRTLLQEQIISLSNHCYNPSIESGIPVVVFIEDDVQLTIYKKMNHHTWKINADPCEKVPKIIQSGASLPELASVTIFTGVCSQLNTLLSTDVPDIQYDSKTLYLECTSKQLFASLYYDHIFKDYYSYRMNDMTKICGHDLQFASLSDEKARIIYFNHKLAELINNQLQRLQKDFNFLPYDLLSCLIDEYNAFLKYLGEPISTPTKNKDIVQLLKDIHKTNICSSAEHWGYVYWVLKVSGKIGSQQNFLDVLHQVIENGRPQQSAISRAKTSIDTMKEPIDDNFVKPKQDADLIKRIVSATLSVL